MLALLGYENTDFTGDQTGARQSKYHFLELDENMNKSPEEVLIKEDCINLFYNLLKTDTKAGTMFGKEPGMRAHLRRGDQSAYHGGQQPEGTEDRKARAAFPIICRLS